MTIDWDDVLDPELSPREVLCERLPKLHRERLEEFRQLVSTPLIFSVEFTDVDRRYTVRLDPDEARGVEGDMIDFPQASARGEEAKWSRSIRMLSELADPADDRIDAAAGTLRLTDELVRGFEQFDGVLTIRLVKIPDGGEPLEFDVILNDYVEPDWAERAHLTVEWPVLEKLAGGQIGPVEAARNVDVDGAMGLAFDIGGYFINELDL